MSNTEGEILTFRAWSLVQRLVLSHLVSNHASSLPDPESYLRALTEAGDTMIDELPANMAARDILAEAMRTELDTVVKWARLKFSPPSI